MKMQLEHILETSIPQKLFEQCENLMASHDHNVTLFSNNYLHNLKECAFASEIVQKLSPFFKWSDHSVLLTVVKACDNPEAAVLLQQFDAQVDLSLPITDYPVPHPIPSMAPYDTSTQTMLAIKLNTELSKVSLQQIVDLRCLVQKYFQITEHSLQLMAVKDSPTTVYWMIAKCISHLINSKILQDYSLHDSIVQEVCVYPGTLFISANALKIGSLSFLSEINEMVSLTVHESMFLFTFCYFIYSLPGVKMNCCLCN